MKTNFYRVSTFGERELVLEEKIHLFISVISSIEVFYISWQEQGMSVAMERLQLLNDLPLYQIALDNELIQVIG